MRGPVFPKLDQEQVRALGMTKRPTLDYSWRCNPDINSIPSFIGKVAPSSTGRPSVMDPVSLEKESPSVRNEIIAKSKRIAPTFNKGAHQYLSDETDPKTIGRK